MGIFLNPKAGNDSGNQFLKLCKNRINGLFVDKTDFIGETIDRFDMDNNLLAFTKPRRFGKTVTAHMLACYYSKGADCKEVFSGLKVSSYSGKKIINGREKEITYEEYLNKHNVIFLDMNVVNTRYNNLLRKSAKIEEVADIVDLTEYLVIKELKEEPEFAPVLAKAGISNIGLSEALSEIHQKLDISFVFIMDEWDLIYREYQNDKALQKKFIDTLTGLFKASDGLACFSLAYLTGILPIKKYNSESALNNFDEYNMLFPGNFAPWFGFTDEEITEISKQSRRSVSKETLKEWYEGYQFVMPDDDGENDAETAGNKGDKQNKYRLVDVYNPNSVSKAISRKECRNYWSSTSSNAELIRLINMNFEGIKDDIINLISGGSIVFDCESFENDMTSIDNKDQVFSLLVCLGYLGCSDEGDFLRSAYVPNREIRSALSSIVRKQPWYNSMPVIERSEKLHNAILNQDAATAASVVEQIHNSEYVSVIGYNREEALIFCLICGLMWRAENDYNTYRELPAGLGYADLIMVPAGSKKLPVMIFEFKKDASPEEALNQVKEKDYPSRYCKGKRYDTVLMIGLSYDSDTKKHYCVIEKA